MQPGQVAVGHAGLPQSIDPPAVASSGPHGADIVHVQAERGLQERDIEFRIVCEHADGRPGVGAAGQHLVRQVPVRPGRGHLVRGAEPVLLRERRARIAHRDVEAKEFRGRHECRTEVIGAEDQQARRGQPALHQQADGFRLALPRGREPDQPGTASPQQRFQLGCRGRQHAPGTGGPARPEQRGEFGRLQYPEGRRVRNHDGAASAGVHPADQRGPGRMPPGQGLQAVQPQPAGPCAQGFDVDFQPAAAGQPGGKRVLGAVAEELPARPAVAHCLQGRFHNGPFNASTGQAAQHLAGLRDQHGGAHGPRH